jgi:hypothetical protein
MSALDRLIANMTQTEGVESVFILDGIGEWLAGAGPLGHRDALEHGKGPLTFLTDSAAEVVGGARNIVLRFPPFALRLHRGDHFVLGVVAGAGARDEVVQLALRVALRQLSRLPEAIFQAGAHRPSPPLEDLVDDRPTQPSIDVGPRSSSRAGRPVPTPQSSAIRGRPGVVPPSHRASGREPPQTSRQSPTTRRESPWAREAARRRRRRNGGGGIWGD